MFEVDRKNIEKSLFFLFFTNNPSKFSKFQNFQKFEIAILLRYHCKGHSRLRIDAIFKTQFLRANLVFTRVGTIS